MRRDILVAFLALLASAALLAADGLNSEQYTRLKCPDGTLNVQLSASNNIPYYRVALSNAMSGAGIAAQFDVAFVGFYGSQGGDFLVTCNNNSLEANTSLQVPMYSGATMSRLTMHNRGITNVVMSSIADDAKTCPVFTIATVDGSTLESYLVVVQGYRRFNDKNNRSTPNHYADEPAITEYDDDVFLIWDGSGDSGTVLQLRVTIYRLP